MGPLIRRWVYREVSTIYDVFQNYMVCSYHALELLNELSSVDYEEMEKVKAESRANQEIVRDELVNMRAGYPGLMK